jgi:propanediol dehydratase-reactivating factor small subunit
VVFRCEVRPPGLPAQALGEQPCSPWRWGQGRAECRRSPWKGDGPQRIRSVRWRLALHGGGLDAEPIYQRESFPESPAIHVTVLPDVDSTAFRWVSVGAEEEGVPCREVPVQFRGETPVQGNPLAAAYAAAQESRLGVGVAAGRDRVVLHEAHMPAERPVWEFPLAGDFRQACRLVGSNAGRLVKRMPLRFEQESALTTDPGPQPDAADLAAIVASIARSLQGRGII